VILESGYLGREITKKTNTNSSDESKVCAI